MSDDTLDVEYIEEEILISHPLEQALDIEEGTTTDIQTHRQTKSIEPDIYDEKDIETDKMFQEIYDAALDAYDEQNTAVQQVEGKYKARAAEVAVQFLNTALNAAKEKANQKMLKEKLEIQRNKVTGPRTLNQNVIVADRNDILKALVKDKDTD